MKLKAEHIKQNDEIFALSQALTVNIMKVRDIMKLVTKEGWYELPGNGSSHRQYKHPEKRGRVTIPGHPNDDVPIGTQRNILKQAGLK